MPAPSMVTTSAPAEGPDQHVSRVRAPAGPVGELVERIVAALVADNAPEAVSSLAGYRAQTVRIGDALARIFGSDPRIARFLLLEAAGIDAEMRERVLDFYDTAAQMTAEYLHHGV